MRRAYAFVLLLPFAVGCDDLIAKLKGGGEDAGAEAAAAVAAPAVDAAAAPAPTDPGTVTTPAPPLTPGANTAVRPGPAPAKTDAGVVVDAGAVKTDGAAPAPTPVPTIPNFFDAGGLLKNFDAGGFKPPFVK